MKFLIFIPLILVVLCAQKCRGQSEDINRNFLIGITWYYSHEEDQNDLNVYRPESYSFPLSRGRSGFQLLPDGSAIYKGISANDIPIDRIGSWELSNDDTHLSIIITAKGTPTNQRFEYTIVSCQEDLLHLIKQNLDSNQTK